MFLTNTSEEIVAYFRYIALKKTSMFFSKWTPPKEHVAWLEEFFEKFTRYVYSMFILRNTYMSS